MTGPSATALLSLLAIDHPLVQAPMAGDIDAGDGRGSVERRGRSVLSAWVPPTRPAPDG